MKNEEKAKELTRNFRPHVASKIQKIALEMAKWKDEKFMRFLKLQLDPFNPLHMDSQTIEYLIEMYKDFKNY